MNMITLKIQQEIEELEEKMQKSGGTLDLLYV